MTSTAPAWRISVTGVVQGVGFRPYVHRLAQRFALRGWVRNTCSDVEIAVQGRRGALEGFVHALRTETPPLARIDGVAITDTVTLLETGFRIVESAPDDSGRQLITPDVATCSECERELQDRDDRRYRYPFITCTNCGPRHSVILGMPYDRARTTMRDFTMCPECRSEYEDIDSRRYHSETNCCARCGPGLRLVASAPLRRAREVPAADPLSHAADMIRDGAVVAVRGLGGFHLAVDATSKTAVQRLRERKRRERKPLAVMVRDLERARQLAHVSDEEAAWLTSAQRPIVVLEARDESPLAPAVTGGLGTVGVMLAYSPLHMLLLDEVQRPLVMTSGNPSSLPLAVTLDEALATLGDIADVFLTHDREIAAPIDDSVVRVLGADVIAMRRSRGFAPLPVPLPIPARYPLLAVGAHLKNTFTLAEGTDAFMSQHIGDLETIETTRLWERSLDGFERMLRITPRVVVRDQHPEYVSTHLAERLARGPTMVTQHHHAHVAAVAAEHGVVERVLGVAFDGTGFGADESIWGGEFLVADLVTYRRVGYLRPAPLPGGDAGARQGWRAAVGYAAIATPDDQAAILAALQDVPPVALAVARQQCERGLNAPRSSSMGRLFDAAAAILGVCTQSGYEGEAAMLLESAADGEATDMLPLPLERMADRWVLDPVPLLAALAHAARAGEDRAALAAAFHESVAAASAEIAAWIAEHEHVDTAVLGGGVFQNARLTASLTRRLTAAGLRVLRAELLPPNDGAISYGQAAIAAARLAMDARTL